MASRYAIYIRHKDNEGYSFSSSYPSLAPAKAEVERINRDHTNVSAIMIESMDAGQEIDPYHHYFAKKVVA